MTGETDKQIADFLNEVEDLGVHNQGGMSIIRKVRKKDTGEEFVIKIMHPTFGSRPQNIDRFYHEIKAHKRLQHPNIIKIVNYGKIEGQYCLIMEYADKGSLRDLLDKTEIISVEVALYIMVSLLKALAYSHENNVVHRDIKPSNVLLTSAGDIFLSDFGISRVEDLTQLTQDGSVIGTPAYMSPEQAGGHRVDALSDIFSAGLVFYELLSGQNPFIADHPGTTLMNIINMEQPPLFEINPTVPPDIERIIDTMLQKDKTKRYADCNAIITNIEKYQTENNCLITRESFGKYVVSPEAYEDESRKNRSTDMYLKAKGVYGDGLGRADLAAVELYKSLFLDPGNEKARDLFSTICTKNGYNFDSITSPKIQKLEESLKDKPDNVAVLLRIVKLCQLEGNILKAVVYSRRLKKLRPHDGYILSQVQTFLPDADDEPLHPTSPDKPVKTNSNRNTEPTITKEKTLSVTSSKVAYHAPLGSFLNTRTFLLAFLLITAGLITYILIMAISGIEPPTLSDHGTDPVIDKEMLNENQKFKEKEIGDELFENAKTALNSGDIDKATKLFEMFIKSFEGNRNVPEAYYHLIKVNERSGNKLRADDLANILIANYTTSFFTLKFQLDKADQALNLGDIQQALWNYDSVYRNKKELTDNYEKMRMYSGFAKAYENDNQLAKAIDMLEEYVLRTNTETDDSLLRFRLAELYLKTGDKSAALEQYVYIRINIKPDSSIFKTVEQRIASLQE